MASSAMGGWYGALRNWHGCSSRWHRVALRGRWCSGSPRLQRLQEKCATQSWHQRFSWSGVQLQASCRWPAVAASATRRYATSMRHDCSAEGCNAVEEDGAACLRARVRRCTWPHSFMAVAMVRWAL